jgi:hypothetical protein
VKSLLVLFAVFWVSPAPVAVICKPPKGRWIAISANQSHPVTLNDLLSAGTIVRPARARQVSELSIRYFDARHTVTYKDAFVVDGLVPGDFELKRIMSPITTLKYWAEERKLVSAAERGGNISDTVVLRIGDTVDLIAVFPSEFLRPFHFTIKRRGESDDGVAPSLARFQVQLGQADIRLNLPAGEYEITAFHQLGSSHIDMDSSSAYVLVIDDRLTFDQFATTAEFIRKSDMSRVTERLILRSYIRYLCSSEGFDHC